MSSDPVVAGRAGPARRDMFLFVSYRRDDTAGHAGRLHDDLVDRLGPRRLFFDVDRIAPGQDFEHEITGALERATVVLALIGPSWLAQTSDGRRIDDEGDYVRFEIASSLEVGKVVIPILLGGATMPSRNELPEAVAALATRQAVVISHARWRADVDDLLAELERVHGRRTGADIARGDALDPLIGRSVDLGLVLEALDQGRLVTLTGTGGSGKTRLAEAAGAALQASGHQAWFVDLSSISDPSLVGSAIAAALRLEGKSDRDPLEAVIQAVGERDGVLVLDNLEQITSVDQPISALLNGAPELRILTTSRAPLGVRGELEIAVEPLGLPSAATASAVESSPAGALFLARARAIGRLRSIDDSSAADIAQLLRRLDGLPLAIELAAARTRAMTPGEIVKRLEREGPASIDREAGDRHRSLRAIFDWTLGLLSPEQVHVLEALAVCAGFDLDLATAVVDDAEIDVVSAIESLVTLGLVAPGTTVGGASRFRLLEPIRAMLLQRQSDGTVAHLRDLHANWLATLSVRWREQSVGGWTSALTERLDANADDIRWALDHLEGASPRRALAMAAGLEAFWQTRGRLAEGLARLEREAALAPEPSIELADSLALRLRMEDAASGATALLELTERTIEVARAVDNRLALLVALGGRLLLAAQGDRETEVAERIRSELAAMDPSELNEHERIQRSWALANAAEAIHGITNDAGVDAIRAFYKEAKASGRSRWLGIGAADLSTTLLGRGEHAEAAVIAAEAVMALRGLDNPASLCWALGILGSSLSELGRTTEAADAILEAAAIAEWLQLNGLVSDALRTAMPVALAAGKPALAARLWGTVVEMRDDGRYRPQGVDIRLGERWLAEAAGRLEPEAIEAAVRAGRAADPLELLRSLTSALQPGSPGVSAGLGQDAVTYA